MVSVVPDGQYHINDTLVVIETTEGERKELSMMQKWPIRVPRPSAKRYPATRPLITGQRILDTMFPLAKGGTAAIPGGFGTGKTMTSIRSQNGLMRMLLSTSAAASVEMR